MTVVGGLALSIVAGLIAVPVVAILAIEVLSALIPNRKHDPGGRRGWICVLVPAHDEGAVLGVTLEALTPQLTREDRLLVVADNCADEIAAIARTMGAEVIERADLVRRGKGYALDLGVRGLANHPPHVVVVIDADCRLGADSLGRLARRTQAAVRPVQALYWMRSPPGSDVMARLREFAWILKNRVRPFGHGHRGPPCQLIGTGMALPWALPSGAELATGEIVEDIRLGLEVARSGHAPISCPEAVATSEFPTDASAYRVQRTRWEHGHLRMIVAEA